MCVRGGGHCYAVANVAMCKLVLVNGIALEGDCIKTFDMFPLITVTSANGYTDR